MSIDESIDLENRRMLQPLFHPYNEEGGTSVVPYMLREQFAMQVIMNLVLAKGYANKKSGNHTRRCTLEAEVISRGYDIRNNQDIEFDIGGNTVRIWRINNLVVDMDNRLHNLSIPLSFPAHYISADKLMDFIEYISDNVEHVYDSFDNIIDEMQRQQYVSTIRQKSLPEKITQAFRLVGLKKMRYKLLDDGIFLELNLHRNKFGGPWLSHKFGDEEIGDVARTMREIYENPRKLSMYPGYKIRETRAIKNERRRQ